MDHRTKQCARYYTNKKKNTEQTQNKTVREILHKQEKEHRTNTEQNSARDTTQTRNRTRNKTVREILHVTNRTQNKTVCEILHVTNRTQNKTVRDIPIGNGNTYHGTWKNTRWLIIIKHKQSARVKCKK